MHRVPAAPQGGEAGRLACATSTPALRLLLVGHRVLSLCSTELGGGCGVMWRAARSCCGERRDLWLSALLLSKS